MIGNNGSTEFNGEKKQTLYAKLGYNIDGMAVSTNYLKETGSADTSRDGSGGGTGSGGSSKGDSMSMLSDKLPKGKVQENISLFGDES